MAKDCCIAFITHKYKLDFLEELSLKQAINIFKDRDFYLVIPDNIDTKYYDGFEAGLKYIKVDSSWLSSYNAYNLTLRKPEFYRLFEDYEYVLIYQTDCWSFYDKLDYFISLDYDWYGAAWPHLEDNIGNGGLSLRKVETMIQVCERYKNDNSIEAEDLWFCIKHKSEFRVCDLRTACNFSCETLPVRYCKLIETVPMGLHGKNMLQYWNREKFLKNVIKKYSNLN